MEICKNKKIPNYNVGDREGFTDYIDFLNFSEIKKPVMKGQDCYGRHFFVVKMIVDNKDIIMETYFQRYRHGNNWQSCGHATKFSLLNTCGSSLNEQQINLLKRIINDEGDIILEEKHKLTMERLFLNKSIRLYDEEKEKAANIIKRNWLVCRYNPNYEMCKKILYRNIDNIYSEYE